MFVYMNRAYKMHSFTLRNIVTRPLGRFLTSSLARPKEAFDPIQEAALKERCFLVDESDKVIGTASKRECHSVREDGTVPLHRAFSVFLFDKKGGLLLQKRADTKITYPGHYTFSCSGHPLDDIGEEFDELNANGVKLAAQRRLSYELGISKQDIPISAIYYLTRIYHMNPGDGVWGDHEICYILIVQADCKLNPNPGEISEFSLVPNGQLMAYLSTLDSPVTPLFKKIISCRLQLWWNNLDDLDSIKDHKHIMMLC